MRFSIASGLILVLLSLPSAAYVGAGYGEMALWLGPIENPATSSITMAVCDSEMHRNRLQNDIDKIGLEGSIANFATIRERTCRAIWVRDGHFLTVVTTSDELTRVKACLQTQRKRIKAILEIKGLFGEDFPEMPPISQSIDQVFSVYFKHYVFSGQNIYALIEELQRCAPFPKR